MDFVRLGPRYNNDYLPDEDIIEGYNSLIWTERFQSAGEFELKTFDVDRISKLLKEDTMVSHLETREVMMVETLTIETVGEGADAVEELTVKGRSAYKILEDRWVESKYQKKRKMRKKYSATSALCVLLWQAVDNPSGKDVTRGDSDPDTEGVVNSYDWNTRDKIPNAKVTEDVPNEGETRWWKLEEGILWPQFEKIMVDADLGIRTLRPVSPNPGKVISVETALANRGDITRTQTADISGLRFEVYAGVDRSDNSGTPVKLSMLQNHLEKPIYVKSRYGYKTMVEVMSDEVAIGDQYRDGETNNEGFSRRVVGHDAGSPEIPDPPEKPEDLGRNPTQAERNDYNDAMDAWKVKMGNWRNKKANLIADFREESLKEAKRVLKQTRRIDMFSGDVSINSPYLYGVHYGLGDIVMLKGDYDEDARMLVAEYVRTEDANGDRGIPGLVAP